MQLVLIVSCMAGNVLWYSGARCTLCGLPPPPPPVCSTVRYCGVVPDFVFISVFRVRSEPPRVGRAQA